MSKSRSTILVLLMAAFAFNGLAMLFSWVNTQPMGLFLADTYYLPLRKYVPPDQQYAMESEVIKIFNEQRSRNSSLPIYLNAIPTLCILVCLVLIMRSSPSERQGDSLELSPPNQNS